MHSIYSKHTRGVVRAFRNVAGARQWGYLETMHRVYSHAPARLFVSFRVSCTRMARAVGPRMNVNTVAMMKSAPPATMVLIAPNAGTAHPVMRYPTMPAREKITPMKL